MRMFIDIPILWKFWFSSTEMLAFLICTQLVIVSLATINLTFFAQIMMSDEALELPLAMKWVSVVVTACELGKSFGS